MTTSKKEPVVRAGELVLTRVFDAPRERVWAAWSIREQLMRWWGQPKGATMPVCTMDFRVGGSVHYRVNLPDGQVIWGLAIYKEIVPQQRLVLEDSFSDEAGNRVVSADLPLMLVTATFDDLGDKTKLTLTHVGIGTGMHSAEQYREGWGQTLDRLQETLAS